MTVMVLATALRDIHEGFSWVVVIANGLAGLWALAAHWYTPLRLRSLWWYTGVAQATIFAQVGIGVGLYAGEDLQFAKFHPFYGFVGIMTVGMIYSYRAQMQPHRYLLYGGGGLFLMGLAIRAILTA